MLDLFPTPLPAIAQGWWNSGTHAVNTVEHEHSTGCSTIFGPYVLDSYQDGTKRQGQGRSRRRYMDEARVGWARPDHCNTWDFNAEDFSIIVRSGARPGLISNNFHQKSTFGERLDNLLGRRTFLTNVSKFLVGGCSNKRMFRSLA